MKNLETTPMHTRGLSTLERTILGLAWLRGPCSTYALMRELSLSASSFHKSRAGTAYSVTKRLLDAGLIEFEPTNGRTRTPQVRITAAGIAALQDWLRPPTPMADVAHSADLLRLRFFFLGVVSQSDRLAFIDDALEGLRAFLERCEGLIPQNETIGDYFGALATISSILETRARIEWLRIARRWVEAPMPEGASWTETIRAALSRVDGPSTSD